MANGKYTIMRNGKGWLVSEALTGIIVFGADTKGECLAWVEANR